MHGQNEGPEVPKTPDRPKGTYVPVKARYGRTRINQVRLVFTPVTPFNEILRRSASTNSEGQRSP